MFPVWRVFLWLKQRRKKKSQIRVSDPWVMSAECSAKRSHDKRVRHWHVLLLPFKLLQTKESICPMTQHQKQSRRRPSACVQFPWFIYLFQNTRVKAIKTGVLRPAPFNLLGDGVLKVSWPARIKERDLTLMPALDFKHRRQQRRCSDRDLSLWRRESASSYFLTHQTPPLLLQPRLVSLLLLVGEEIRRARSFGGLRDSANNSKCHRGQLIGWPDLDTCLNAMVHERVSKTLCVCVCLFVTFIPIFVEHV